MCGPAVAVERPDWAPCRTQYLRLELCYLDKIRQRKLALGIDIEKEETVGEDAEGESGKKIAATTEGSARTQKSASRTTSL